MLDIQVTGFMPQIQPLPEIMQKLSMQMEQDVLVDVANGGNPTWQARVHPPGQASLGYIPKTIQHSSDETSASVSFGDDLPYAKVHEVGWEIPRTLRMKKFFWAKWYETREDFWKAMAISNKPTVSIPQRSVLPGIINRAESYAQFIGEQIAITHAVPIH